MFFKIYALKNFAIFTGKHLCWSLFWFFGVAFNELISCFVGGLYLVCTLKRRGFFKKKKKKEKAGVVFGHRMKLISSFLTKKTTIAIFMVVWVNCITKSARNSILHPEAAIRRFSTK